MQPANPQWQQQPANAPPPPQPSPPPPKRRFRREIVWVLLAVVLAAWLLSGVEPAGTWDELMDAMGVHNRPRHKLLACLSLAGIALAALLRLARKPQE